MDTLTILEKLKKKRPDLKEDPLMMELEMGLTEGQEGMDMAGKMPVGGNKGGTALSYLDEEAAAGDEMEAGEDLDADALMMELDAEEGIESGADSISPADELAPEGSEDVPTSYLDEEEEDFSEEAPPARKKGKSGVRTMPLRLR